MYTDSHNFLTTEFTQTVSFKRVGNTVISSVLEGQMKFCGI